MAQQEQGLPWKAGGLSSIPETYLEAEGESYPTHSWLYTPHIHFFLERASYCVALADRELTI